ncbi:MAG: TiaS agmantine-binding domain-containing protein [Thermoplasmata archaeon]
MYIGIDDTDSGKGSCTTYVLTEVIRSMSLEYDIIGYPRLVRLNPNIPWKTRGNGALSLRIGKGSGKKKLCGMIGDVEYYCYERGINAENKELVLGKIKPIVEKLARVEDPNTNPGIVVSEKKFSQSLYWDAVRDVLSIDYVKNVVETQNALYKMYKNGRGIIGASAAISWRPLRKTYELISYRDSSRWNETKREVDESTVKWLEYNEDLLFNTYDAFNHHSCISPHTTCPILYGVRALNPKKLLEIRNTIKSEKVDRWFIYETNQGTDDHIVKSSIKNLRAFGSYKIHGHVVKYPVKINGGHAFVEIADNTGSIILAFYSESGQMNKIATLLIPGDYVCAYGSVKEGLHGYQMNVEKLIIKKLALKNIKISNPVCDICGKRMKSYGKGGYRCKTCHTKKPKDKASFSYIDRGINIGVYVPPTSRFRHLAMPPKIAPFLRRIVDC